MSGSCIASDSTEAAARARSAPPSVRPLSGEDIPLPEAEAAVGTEAGVGRRRRQWLAGGVAAVLLVVAAGLAAGPQPAPAELREGAIHRRAQALAAQVHPSPSRPHDPAREGAQRRVYVHVGSTNRRADRELIEALCRCARGESFDGQPMPGLGSEVLGFGAASECFAGVRDRARGTA